MEISLDLHFMLIPTFGLIMKRRIIFWRNLLRETVFRKLWVWKPLNNLSETLSGWCFGTLFLFSHDYWECHHPNWRTIFFQRGGPTTSYVTGSCWVHFAYGPMVRDIPGLSLARKGIETEAAGRFVKHVFFYGFCVYLVKEPHFVYLEIFRWIMTHWMFHYAEDEHSESWPSICHGFGVASWDAFFFLRTTAASGGTALVKFVGKFKT